VAACGGLLFTWSLGSAVGPTAAGFVMGHVGPGGLFAYLAVVLGVLGVFTSARMLVRSEVPRERRGGYLPATAAPPRNSEFVSRAVSALRYPGATNSVWQAVLDQNPRPRD
jgi:hypothetical protein